MTICRILIIAFSFSLAHIEVTAAPSGMLRILRAESFNASNRQPTIWLDEGPATDLSLNQPLELQVEPGPHIITIATRVPSDPGQFMQRRQEQIAVEAGEVVDIKLTWAASLFAGQHVMKVTRVNAPRVEPPIAPLPISPQLQELPLGITGKSVRTWPNGDQYEGDFVNGIMQGKGSFKFATGNRYQGDMVNGKKSGKGILTWASGNRYEGDFVNDALTGRGILTFANGKRGEGNFVNGKMSGRGIYTFANGTRYEGDFVNDVLTGRGILTFIDGKRYEGDVVNGAMTGRGVFTSAKGDRYEGYFLNNRSHGEGLIVMSSGRRIEGTFRDGKLVEEKQPTANTTNASSGSGTEALGVLLQILGTAVEARNASPSEMLRDTGSHFPSSVTCDTRRTTMGANLGMNQSYEVNCR